MCVVVVVGCGVFGFFSFFEGGWGINFYFIF